MVVYVYSLHNDTQGNFEISAPNKSCNSYNDSRTYELDFGDTVDIQGGENQTSIPLTIKVGEESESDLKKISIRSQGYFSTYIDIAEAQINKVGEEGADEQLEINFKELELDYYDIPGGKRSQSQYFSLIFDKAFSNTPFKFEDERITYEGENRSIKELIFDAVAYIILRNSLLQKDTGISLGRDFLKNWESELKGRGSINIDDLREKLEDRGLVFLDSELELIVNAFNSGKHIILSGAPGCGKTALAKAMAEHQVQEKAVICTANPNWTSDDLIGRYLPHPNGKGLEFDPGFLLQSLEYANNILIIDEINRCDLDACFGELFTVLSRKPARLPFKKWNEENKKFHNYRIILPSEDNDENNSKSDTDYVLHDHFRIIGTMNDYDKSKLHQFSNALKRRFITIPVSSPEKEKLIEPITKWIHCSLSNEHQLPVILRELFQNNSTLIDANATSVAIIKDFCDFFLKAENIDVNQDRWIQTNNNKPRNLAYGVALIIIPNIDPEQPRVDLKLAWNSIHEAFSNYPDVKEIIQNAFQHTDWWNNADEYCGGFTDAVENWEALQDDGQ